MISSNVAGSSSLFGSDSKSPLDGMSCDALDGAELSGGVLDGAADSLDGAELSGAEDGASDSLDGAELSGGEDDGASLSDSGSLDGASLSESLGSSTVESEISNPNS